jgi:ribosomal protein L30/L7E
MNLPRNIIEKHRLNVRLLRLKRRNSRKAHQGR